MIRRSLFVLALCTLPLFASAHTRWFAEEGLPVPHSTEPTALYLSIWTLIGFAVISVGIILHQRNILRLSFLRPKSSHAYERAASTFTMVVGAFLLIAGTHEYLFSPNLTVEAGIPGILFFIQIAIGLAFLVGIGTRFFAIVLTALWATTFFFTGWIALIENIWVLSTALFITAMGNDYFSIISISTLQKKCSPFKKYALSYLRLGTGITLVTLGLSEKILAPEFGLSFLSQYQWNFMQLLGFNFSDYLFTLSAGSVEILLGLVFILGIMTRLNALVTAVIFTIPLFILGPIELTGHLPHFAAVVILLLFGNGGHFTFFKTYEDACVT